MVRVIISATLCLLSLPVEAALNSLPSVPRARIDVYLEITEGTVSRGLFGINLAIGAPRAKLIADPGVIARVTAMGIGSIRFPNGCLADIYDWKHAEEAGHVTVEEFLEFCDAVGVEPYYTINLQGGTEGLDGPVPQGATLGERIRYRHTAPNPCGNTNYHFGTLAEAVELVETYTCGRMLAGKRPIVCYEMGNENWGQAKTDWPPEVYAETIRQFAVAMESAVAASAEAHRELRGLDLRITAVGFPVMGNNQDPLAYQDRGINVAWTAALNALYQEGVIDAVQEHFYPFGWGGGTELVWTMHNLENIFYAREGRPNPRLGGYVDPDIAYDMPMEITEWNVKCWGNAPQYDVVPDNPGFENGLAGWKTKGTPGVATVEVFQAPAEASGTRPSIRPPGRSALRRSTRAHGYGAGGGPNVRNGTAAARISLVDAIGFAELSQSKPIGQAREGFHAAAWVWTTAPDNTRLLLRQSNPGEHAGAVIGEATPHRVREWEWIVCGGKFFADTTDVELAVRVEGASAEVFVDATRFVYWKTSTGTMPMSAATFAQRLFAVDAIRVMLKHNVPIAHWHHLVGNYPCSCLETDGDARNNYQIFTFLADRVGNRLAKTTCQADTFDFDSYWDEWATDFNALPPSTKDVPVVSALATADDGHTYLLLVNPLTDRDVAVDIRIHSDDIGKTAEVRTLSGEDYPINDAEVTEETIPAGRRFTHTVPAHSAQILTLRTPATASFRGGRTR